MKDCTHKWWQASKHILCCDKCGAVFNVSHLNEIKNGNLKINITEHQNK